MIKTKYRGMTMNINKINEDEVEFWITNNGVKVEDTEGRCVTVEQAVDECKSTIDDIIDL